MAPPKLKRGSNEIEDGPKYLPALLKERLDTMYPKGFRKSSTLWEHIKKVDKHFCRDRAKEIRSGDADEEIKLYAKNATKAKTTHGPSSQAAAPSTGR